MRKISYRSRKLALVSSIEGRYAQSNSWVGRQVGNNGFSHIAVYLVVLELGLRIDVSIRFVELYLWDETFKKKLVYKPIQHIYDGLTRYPVSLPFMPWWKSSIMGSQLNLAVRKSIIRSRRKFCGIIDGSSKRLEWVLVLVDLYTSLLLSIDSINLFLQFNNL